MTPDAKKKWAVVDFMPLPQQPPPPRSVPEIGDELGFGLPVATFGDTKPSQVINMGDTEPHIPGKGVRP